MNFFNAVLYLCMNMLIFELWLVRQKTLEIVENSICLSGFSCHGVVFSLIICVQRLL